MPSFDCEEALENLNTSKEGLSSHEVILRRSNYGWNELPESSVRSWVLLFF
ncbi:cation-transporting P-type ATPase [Algoriphagus persicinus]|uniref:cation-transporting P-type ATPase n=1 Tax=Algoriphagus persicinus TaxID=3108754 RepID=UPI003A5CE9E6